MIRRGSIHLVDLDPTLGSEASKVRPAVIVSNDTANATAHRLGRGVVTVVPVTSNVRRVYPFQVYLTISDSGLARESKAQAEQIRAVDVTRIGDQIGLLVGGSMRELDEAIRVHLSL